MLTNASCSIAQTLGSHILSLPGDLSSTPDGRSWVIKALHPSDPISNVRGLPDETSCPNVVLSYYNVFRVSAPAAAVNSWGFDMTVTPDVIHQACVIPLDHTGLPATAISFLNTSLTTASPTPTYGQLWSAFNNLGIEAHRLIGFGVSGYQDGPALANQGTISASQFTVHPLCYGVNGAALSSQYRARMFQNTDLATYESSQHMPNAYFGESKDGVYLPLRLSTDAFEFRNESKWMFFQGVGQAPTTLPTAYPPATPPYPAVQRVWASAGNVVGDLVNKPLNSIWGGISARNLSTSTSFAFYFRVIIEARVRPISSLASQQTMSPSYDPVALASYFRISRELKDAYPVSYNDLGKLWSVIQSAARFASPIVSLIPHPVAQAVGAGLKAVGDIKREKGRDRPPLAAVTRAQREIDATPSPRRGRSRSVAPAPEKGTLSARFARTAGKKR